VSKRRGTIIVGTISIVVMIALVAGFFIVQSINVARANIYRAHIVTAKPIFSPAHIASSSAQGVTFGCQAINAVPTCYQPQQIRTAYGIQSLINRGITGTGRTIVIIDAFQNPDLASDLSIFDSTFGLPDPTFTQIAPFGLTPFDENNADQVGWSGEIALDVEWAHAIAPAANIVLALAKSDKDVDLFNVTKYVVDNNLGDIISQSFGEAESCVDRNLLKVEHALFEKATSEGITLFASSGNNGVLQPACDGAANAYIQSVASPASDPLVTAVGGTNLTANPLTGAYGSETAWNDVRLGNSATQGFSGGGYSNIYRRPIYQYGVQSTRLGHRGVPDVAYDAGRDGGVLAHWGVGNVVYGGGDSPTDPATFFVFGGTDAGTPQWAGLAALADQFTGHRLGFLNSTIYRIAIVGPLNSITDNHIASGSNGFNNVTGFQAGKGWNPVIGWGSPKAGNLVPLLAAFDFFGDGTSAENYQGG
jgi:subtilase family serine protease